MAAKYSRLVSPAKYGYSESVFVENVGELGNVIMGVWVVSAVVVIRLR